MRVEIDDVVYAELRKICEEKKISSYHRPVDWQKIVNWVRQYVREKHAYDQRTERMIGIELSKEQVLEELKKTDPAGMLQNVMFERDNWKRIAEERQKIIDNIRNSIGNI